VTTTTTAADTTGPCPDSDGWKWFYHPSSREWSYKKCTPNTAAV
jgi:hypothetical protein